jgi:hypothetical protein
MLDAALVSKSGLRRVESPGLLEPVEVVRVVLGGQGRVYPPLLMSPLGIFALPWSIHAGLVFVLTDRRLYVGNAAVTGRVKRVCGRYPLGEFHAAFGPQRGYLKLRVEDYEIWVSNKGDFPDRAKVIAAAAQTRGEP